MIKPLYASQKLATQAYDITLKQLRNTEHSNSLTTRERDEAARLIRDRLRRISAIREQGHL